MESDNLSNVATEEDLALSREVTLHHRYEWIHIANDAVISLWFLVGSVFFFYASLQHLGTWLFVLGSLQMLMGPVIRTMNKLHVRNIVKKNIHF